MAAIDGTRGLKVGVILPMFSGDAAKVLDAAREAEDLGFDGAFVFDHFFPPGAPRDRPALEAFTALAGVIAATHRVTVGTLVTRASLRPVGLLAKTAAWLDAASGGRMVLGVGTGDPVDRPEHDAYGIPMLDTDGRRAHLEETVRALKSLFAGEAYGGGDLVPAVEGPLRPPPARDGGPPVWLGAQSERVVRMAGRVADGWNGWGMDGETFARRVAVLREEAEAAGRRVDPTWAGIALVGEDRQELEKLVQRRRERGMEDHIWKGTAEELAGFLGDLREAGATWAVVVAAGPADRRKLIAAEVLPALG